MSFWEVFCNVVHFLRRKDVRHYAGAVCVLLLVLHHAGGDVLLLRGVTEHYGSVVGLVVLCWLVSCAGEWLKVRLQLRAEARAVQDALRQLRALGEDEKAVLRDMVSAKLSQIFMEDGHKVYALLMDAGLLRRTDSTDCVENGHRVVQFSMTKACREVLNVQGKAAELLGVAAEG